MSGTANMKDREPVQLAQATQSRSEGPLAPKQHAGVKQRRRSALGPIHALGVAAMFIGMVGGLSDTFDVEIRRETQRRAGVDVF